MTRPLVRTRARRYRFIRLASSGSAASLPVDWNQIKRQTRFAPLPQPTPARRGWLLYICRKRASPQPAGEGLGVGVAVRTRQTCPQRTTRKSGRSAIARSSHRSVALPVQCALPPRKPSASSGGICATEFLRLAHISGGRFELAATSPILPVTRHALSSRSMAASTERGQPPMNNGPKFSKRAVTACCAIGNDVLSNIDSVLDDILSAITTTPTPTPTPSPQGGGEHTECVATVLRRSSR